MLALFGVLVLLFSVQAGLAENIRVSVAHDGGDSDGVSYDSSISGDGRYVVFVSEATNLVPDDTNEVSDVFVRDMVSKTTRRISISQSGDEGNDESSVPKISKNGRYVVFGSAASNLVPNDRNRRSDIFVVDLQANTIKRVNIGKDCKESTTGGGLPSISGDGKVISFFTSTSFFVGAYSASCPSYKEINNVTIYSSIPPSLNYDGKFIAYQIETSTGYRVLHHKLSTNKILTVSDGVDPSISDNGMLVAYANARHDADLNEYGAYIYDVSTRKSKLQSFDAEGRSSLHVVHGPQISGDGNSIIFHAYEFHPPIDFPWLNGGPYIRNIRTGRVDRPSIFHRSDDLFIAGGASINKDGKIGVFETQNAMIEEDGNDYVDVYLFKSPAKAPYVFASSFQQGNPPQNATDEDFNTRWSAQGDGQWLAMDLGDQQLVTQVYLAWYHDDIREAVFDIQVSDDGKQWNTVFSGSSGDLHLNQGYRAVNLFETTRYVRYLGHGNTITDWNSVTEFAIINETDSLSLELDEIARN